MTDQKEQPIAAPALAVPEAPRSPGLLDTLAFAGRTASPALQVMLDDRLFERAKLIAKYMSAARGITPPHLIGATEACFAVVVNAITWKLNPFAVAQCTYQTPGGVVGYEGKLVQAILENSGVMIGSVKYEHYGRMTLGRASEKITLRSNDARVTTLLDGGWSIVEDRNWDRLVGKFKKQVSPKGKDYVVPTWTDEDAVGLGVTVRARIVGEDEPREWSFDLVQAYPRNSTLWATDPRTQICYTAVRRFANVAAPGILLGVPFDRDEAVAIEQSWGADHARDVTPAARPLRADFAADDSPDDASPRFTLIDLWGEVTGSYSAGEFSERLRGEMGRAQTIDQLEALLEHNAEAIDEARPHLDSGGGLIDEAAATHATRLSPPPAEAAAEPESEPAPTPTPTPSPSNFEWVSSSGSVTSFADLKKWVAGVKSALSKTRTREQVETARRNNNANMEAYAKSGGVYTAAVAEAIRAFDDALGRIS